MADHRGRSDAPIDELTEVLAERLQASADDATRRHWEGYVKGAWFRGVPMARTRAVVRGLWREGGLAARDVDELLVLAQAWWAAEPTEDKLAGVLLVAEHLADRLELRHAPALAAPLAGGHLADWNVVDWYAVKALSRFVRRPDAAAAVLAWADAPGLWQRRAAVVAFVPLAPDPAALDDDVVAGLLDACAANLAVPERFAHTGPGWVLRELSKGRPDLVSAFVDAHPELLPEARRMATARLRPGPYRRR